MFEYNLYKQSADYLKNIFPSGIKTALILGSGLGNAAEKMTDKIEVDYSDIPGFARSTVESHRGVMSAGRLFGTECIVMSGRFHYYEGYDFDKTAFPVYVMKLLGVENLIVTNAAGGINEQFSAGNFMAISDHIKLTALSPARGRNDDRFGERFFDMTNAYDAEFLKLVNQTAADENITLRNGVYAFMSGRSLKLPPR